MVQLVRHLTLDFSSGLDLRIVSSKPMLRGAWVAQWVKASAFSSGYDLRVLGSSPAWGSLLSREPASSSLSACLSAYL